MTDLEPIRALNLDSNQQQSFIRFYRNLPEKPASTIRFFNHTEFYVVHGDDAKYTAAQSFNTNVVKYMGESPKLSYLCLNQNNFERYVRELLLVKQYRVEVYVKPAQSKNYDWILEYKGSPGNLQQFEGILFDNSDAIISGTIMGIQVAKGNIFKRNADDIFVFYQLLIAIEAPSSLLGICCVDLIERTFSVIELVDNEYYTELEGLIAPFTPKECVIPAGESADLIQLNKMLTKNGVLVIKSKKSDFSYTDVAQDLNRLLFFSEDQQRNVTSLSEYGKTEAMASLQAVIKYLNLINDDQNFNNFKLTTQEINRYVRLDNAAIKALDLFSTPGTSTINNYDSVYRVLNSCSTQQGQRLLDQWIKQPIRDLTILSERLDVVETFINDSGIRNTLSLSLNKLPDLTMLAKKIGMKKCTLEDCYKVYQTVDSVPALVHVLRSTKNISIRALIVDPISELLTDLEKYQSLIEETLDLDLVDRGEFFIKPKFDNELNEIHKQKCLLEEKMQKVHTSAIDDLGKSVKMVNSEQHGYHFRVTLKEEPSLRSNKKYSTITVMKSGIRFTTEKMGVLNASYSALNDAYEKKQKTVVEEILSVAGGYSDTLRSLNSCIALADVLVAFANTAANSPIKYVRPKLLPMGSGIINLKQARHPCLEKQDGANFIPNDVNFKQGERNVILITGPNMGGKSTYMKTVGISVLLAHIGCFVPCESAEISIVDCILARVGADDCEMKGLSTFMLEMVETSSIIRSVTSNSLVIIDELGRGTSTYDGCGIAWAVAEHLAKEVKAFVLFATHYHEITQLEEMITGVVNVHVTAIVSDKTLTPLYQVSEGICDQSYGIHCARAVEFSEDLIKFSIDYQNQLEDVYAMKYVKDLDVTTKRKIIDEGDEIIASALEPLKNVDKNIPEKELKQMVKQIKLDLAANDNLFIKGLVED